MMPYYLVNQSPYGRSMFPKLYNRNHPILRISQAEIRHTLADQFCLWQILSCCENKQSDMPVRGRQRVSIDIDEADRHSWPARRFRLDMQPWNQKRQEKALQNGYPHW
jgi:hypothetical protein